MLTETARKIFSMTLGQRKKDNETRLWNQEVEKSIERNMLAKRIGTVRQMRRVDMSIRRCDAE